MTSQSQSLLIYFKICNRILSGIFEVIKILREVIKNLEKGKELLDYSNLTNFEANKVIKVANK